jgi:hypothetical protein
MKSFFALLAIILFMAGTIVLGPIYLLLFLSQQFFYMIDIVKTKNHKVAH